MLLLTASYIGTNWALNTVVSLGFRSRNSGEGPGTQAAVARNCLLLPRFIYCLTTMSTLLLEAQRPALRIDQSVRSGNAAQHQINNTTSCTPLAVTLTWGRFMAPSSYVSVSIQTFGPFLPFHASIEPINLHSGAILGLPYPKLSQHEAELSSLHPPQSQHMLWPPFSIRLWLNGVYQAGSFSVINHCQCWSSASCSVEHRCTCRKTCQPHITTTCEPLEEPAMWNGWWQLVY